MADLNNSQKFVLSLIMAITKQEPENSLTQKRCREYIIEKIKDSKELMKMFREDCILADNGQETTNLIKLSAYGNYVFGPRLN